MGRLKLVGRVDRRTPIWWWGPKRRARWRAEREVFMRNLSESYWNPEAALRAQLRDAALRGEENP